MAIHQGAIVDKGIAILCFIANGINFLSSMPKKTSSRRTQSNVAISTRWRKKDTNLRSKDSSDDEFDVEMHQHETMREAEEDEGVTDFLEKIDPHIIGDLFELCRQGSGSRKLSTLLYMLLRHLGFPWRLIDDIFGTIGAYRCETAHKWAQVFLTGDIETFLDDGRGGKHSDAFYDIFPELEIEAKSFVIKVCSGKTADFAVADLAKFVDSEYYEVTGIVKVDAGLIRSEQSCRLDLRRWGARSEANSQRPYFEGHERSDVVAHRKQFVEYFLGQKENYYTVTDGEQPVWHSPIKNPCILICHDEWTFRSGDVSHKRWIVNEESAFFSKGRGRSYMVSDFLVSHPSGPFFSLSATEFRKAAKQYPALSIDHDLNYVERSATVGINVGHDAYFDNETILLQFERLFQMLPFKTEYQGHDIEVLVDNARTHSAKEFSLNDFGKGIGTRCPVKSIEYLTTRGRISTVSCYFTRGENKGKSKGLLALAEELKLDVRDDIKLDDLRQVLSKHQAFKSESRLEKLARKYNGKVIFVPKYHCELNHIEGLWCSMKHFTRQKSDQTFNTLLRLIPASRAHFFQNTIYLKWFRRFWRALDAYNKGQTYADVLQLFFSRSCKSGVDSHRRISNTNLAT